MAWAGTAGCSPRAAGLSVLGIGRKTFGLSPVLCKAECETNVPSLTSFGDAKVGKYLKTIIIVVKEELSRVQERQLRTPQKETEHLPTERAAELERAPQAPADPVGSGRGLPQSTEGTSDAVFVRSVEITQKELQFGLCHCLLVTI